MSGQAEADDRVRGMSFSSEAAQVPRFFGKEVLDHGPKSVRKDFLNSGRAPLLFGHREYEQPIGVVKKGSVRCEGGVGRCDVRFGKTGGSADALTNVDDGILTNTSVGYRVHKMVLDSRGEDGKDSVYRVTDWEPYEVSLVGVPADRSVGIGREAGETTFTRGSHMNEEERKRKEEADAKAKAEADAKAKADAEAAARAAAGGSPRVEVVSQGRSATEQEQDRIKAIRNMCEADRIAEETRNMWITGGTSVVEVSDQILKIRAERSKGAPSVRVPTDLDLSPKDLKRFSIVKAIRAVAEKDWSFAGFELECNQAIAKKMDKLQPTNRFYVPADVQYRRPIAPEAIEAHANPRLGMYGARANHLVGADLLNKNGYFTRAVTVGTTTAGGYLVETINLSFIELLRNRTVMFRLGATVLSGLVGNVNIPKQTSAATAYWLTAETGGSGEITESDPGFNQLQFTPHTVGGYTEISRLLLLQSSPDIEGIVNADLAAVVGIAVDYVGINGSGTAGQPHGIIGLTGVGTATGTTLGLAGLLSAQGNVGAANVVPVRGGWAAPFGVTQLLRGRNEFSNTYSPLWYGSVWDADMLGYPGLASNQIPSGDLVFGDWAQVVVGEWGVLEIEVNPYADFKAGVIGVRAIMTMDIEIRYPAAFYVITSIT